MLKLNVVPDPSPKRPPLPESLLHAVTGVIFVLVVVVAAGIAVGFLLLRSRSTLAPRAFVTAGLAAVPAALLYIFFFAMV